MKNIFTTLVILFLFEVTLNAQAPNWVWVNGDGGSGFEKTGHVVTDANGNCYIAGIFTSTTLGPLIYQSN